MKRSLKLVESLEDRQYKLYSVNFEVMTAEWNEEDIQKRLDEVLNGFGPDTGIDNIKVEYMEDV